MSNAFVPTSTSSLDLRGTEIDAIEDPTSVRCPDQAPPTATLRPDRAGPAGARSPSIGSTRMMPIRPTQTVRKPDVKAVWNGREGGTPVSPTISNAGPTCVTVAAPTVGESTHTLPSPTRPRDPRRPPPVPEAAIRIDPSPSTDRSRRANAAGSPQACPSARRLPPRPRRRRQRLPQRRRSRRARRRAPRRAHDAQGGGRKVVDHPPSQIADAMSCAVENRASARFAVAFATTSSNDFDTRADERSGGAVGLEMRVQRGHLGVPTERRFTGEAFGTDGRANRCRLAHPPGRPDLLGGHVVDCSVSWPVFVILDPISVRRTRPKSDR